MSEAVHLAAKTPALLIVCIAAIILFVEAGLLVGLVLPGASTVLVLGFLADPVNDVISPVVACVTAVAATATGAHYGYLRGRRREASAKSGRLDRWIGPRRKAQAISLIERNAVLAIALAHCIGVLRTLMPRIVGRSEISYQKFALSNLPGAVFWSLAMISLGYVARAALERMDRLVNLSGWLILIIAVGSFSWYFVKSGKMSKW
jgi:membrane-associated protein